MNKKISLGTAISIAAITAVFAVVITYTAAISIFDSRMNSVTERQNMYQILSEIDITVRQNYYGEISESYLQRNISHGYIEGLNDKYSFYLSADEYQLTVNENLGYTFGLGMDISKASDGNIQVNVVYDGSPASKAGIVKGDLIVNTMGKDVLSVGYDRAVKLIGEASPKVSVVISRDGERTAYELTKSKFETKSVDRRMINENVGIITIYEFNAKTPAQFNAALTYLRNSDAKGVIIDLRDNSGINYEAACDILDTLLPAGAIMNVTDKNGKVIQKYTSDAKYIDLPMEVLINEKTEGAAELFAAVMMNYQKGETIGTTTAGHDTVQEIFQLSNGGAVQLTVGKWSDSLSEFVKNGAIVPQFEVILTAYQQINRYLLADEEDPQLQTAMDRITLEIIAQNEEDMEENEENEENQVASASA